MKPRPYQTAAIDALRGAMAAGNKRIILCAPTGAGKTVMFSLMVQAAIKKAKKCLIVTDRIELLTQAGGALERLGLTPVRIAADTMVRSTDAPLYTAMVETLERRADKEPYCSILKSLDLVIFDEAHKTAFDKIVKHLPADCFVIGATATPIRQDKTKPLDAIYSKIVESITVGDLVSQGYLAKPHSYGVPVDLKGVGKKGGDYDMDKLANFYSERKTYVGVVDNYQRLTPNKKAICFTPNLASSQQITREFQLCGIPCKHIDGYMDATERRSILQWFAQTPNAVICNMGILTTGFDAPDIEVVILYRATTSVALFLQMVGRGSRVTESKQDFTVLDFGDNFRRHGFWETDRNWTLAAKEKKEQAPPMKFCDCGAILYASARVCEECGNMFESKREVTEIHTELVLLPNTEIRAIVRRQSIEDKAKAAKAGLVSPYWVVHNLSTVKEVYQFMNLMGWKTGWWNHNRHRFPNIKC